MRLPFTPIPQQTAFDMRLRAWLDASQEFADDPSAETATAWLKAYDYANDGWPDPGLRAIVAGIATLFARTEYASAQTAIKPPNRDAPQQQTPAP